MLNDINFQFSFLHNRWYTLGCGLGSVYRHTLYPIDVLLDRHGLRQEISITRISTKAIAALSILQSIHWLHFITLHATALENRSLNSLVQTQQ